MEISKRKYVTKDMEETILDNIELIISELEQLEIQKEQARQHSFFEYYKVKKSIDFYERFLALLGIEPDMKGREQDDNNYWNKSKNS